MGLHAGWAFRGSACRSAWALRDTEIAGHSFLQVPQPGAMAGALLAARVAVVLQCVTVYPVLLYIVRAQFFTAFIYRKAYPGPLPVLLLSCLLAGCTTLVTVLRIPIATVLRFVGAIAALVCVYSLPVLVHAIESRRLGDAHAAPHRGSSWRSSAFQACLSLVEQFA